jgi:trans-2,3-dihydro-3-hydroxyanthranilate isomerase
MKAYRYHLVDVFTTARFGGNPLAVFLDAADLPEELRQPIARELNLSETTFVTRLDGERSDFRVRIFTPARELPMAGHPTVGTAFVLHHLGLIAAPGAVTFEEGVGPILVELALDEGGRLVATMNQPLPVFGPVNETREAIAEMLSIPVDGLHPDYPIQIVGTGMPFLYVPVRDLATIARCRPRLDRLEALRRDGLPDEVFAFTLQTINESAAVHARMFAPSMGISEDPATGAACGPLGAYLLRYGLAASGQPVICEQGYEMGRPSEITITVEAQGGDFTAVRVGGNSVYVGRGEIVVDD